MNCPNCQDVLSEINYEGACIRTCNGCGGEFLGPSEIKHIVKSRDERFPTELRADLAQHQPEFGLREEEPHRELACPDCHEIMQLVNYAADSGVHVDRCPQCGGVWLDNDELEHIQVIMERWADEAPDRIRGIAGELESARQSAAEATAGSFKGSRFAFVNALINRFLDAA